MDKPRSSLTFSAPVCLHVPRTITITYVKIVFYGATNVSTVTWSRQRARPLPIVRTPRLLRPSLRYSLRENQRPPQLSSAALTTSSRALLVRHTTIFHSPPTGSPMSSLSIIHTSEAAETQRARQRAPFRRADETLPAPRLLESLRCRGGVWDSSSLVASLFSPLPASSSLQRSCKSTLSTPPL